jgi:TPR repeat protein
VYKQGNGVRQDNKAAAKYYRLAADQGLALAQNALGVMLNTGDGVAQDYVEAEKYYRLAAVQGDAAALCNLGGMYSSGTAPDLQGTSQQIVGDDLEALKWWALAAEQGSELATTSIRVVLKRYFPVGMRVKLVGLEKTFLV